VAVVTPVRHEVAVAADALVTLALLWWLALVGAVAGLRRLEGAEAVDVTDSSCRRADCDLAALLVLATAAVVVPGAVAPETRVAAPALLPVARDAALTVDRSCCGPVDGWASCSCSISRRAAAMYAFSRASRSLLICSTHALLQLVLNKSYIVGRAATARGELAMER
jgi:hypothetical protein